MKKLFFLMVLVSVFFVSCSNLIDKDSLKLIGTKKTAQTAENYNVCIKMGSPERTIKPHSVKFNEFTEWTFTFVPDDNSFDPIVYESPVPDENGAFNFTLPIGSYNVTVESNVYDEKANTNVIMSGSDMLDVEEEKVAELSIHVGLKHTTKGNFDANFIIKGNTYFDPSDNGTGSYDDNNYNEFTITLTSKSDPKAEPIILDCEPVFEDWCFCYLHVTGNDIPSGWYELKAVYDGYIQNNPDAGDGSYGDFIELNYVFTIADNLVEIADGLTTPSLDSKEITLIKNDYKKYYVTEGSEDGYNGISAKFPKNLDDALDNIAAFNDYRYDSITLIYADKDDSNIPAIDISNLPSTTKQVNFYREKDGDIAEEINFYTNSLYIRSKTNDSRPLIRLKTLNEDKTEATLGFSEYEDKQNKIGVADGVSIKINGDGIMYSADNKSPLFYIFEDNDNFDAYSDKPIMTVKSYYRNYPLNMVALISADEQNNVIEPASILADYIVVCKHETGIEYNVCEDEIDVYFTQYYVKKIGTGNNNVAETIPDFVLTTAEDSEFPFPYIKLDDTDVRISIEADGDFEDTYFVWLLNGKRLTIEPDANEYIDINFAKVDLEETNVLTCIAFNNTDETYKSVGETIYIIDAEPLTMADANITYNFVSSPSTITVSFSPTEFTSSDGYFEDFEADAFTRDSEGNIYYAKGDSTNNQLSIVKLSSNGIGLNNEGLYNLYDTDIVPTEIAYDEHNDCIWIATSNKDIYYYASNNFDYLCNITVLASDTRTITALYAKEGKIYIGVIDSESLSKILIYDAVNDDLTDTINIDDGIITDITITDEKLCVLQKERSIRYLGDDFHIDAARGALILADIDTPDEYSYYFLTDSNRPDNDCLFGPDRFLAVMPKKLVISDEGLPSYLFVDDSRNEVNTSDSNRIVTVDLDEMTFESEYTSSKFSEAISIEINSSGMHINGF